MPNHTAVNRFLSFVFRANGFSVVMTFALIACVIACCTNPFAPKLDTSDRIGGGVGDQRTIEGFFETFRFSYLTRDTTLYGELIANDFQFTFTNTQNQETWARDIEMQTTYGLFRNTVILDLQWNSIVFQTNSEDSLQAEVWRTFFLRFGFNDANTQELQGQARLILIRSTIGDVWQMTRWDDFTQ